MWRTYGAAELLLIHCAVILPFFFFFPRLPGICLWTLLGWPVRLRVRTRGKIRFGTLPVFLHRYIWSAVGLRLCSRALSTGVSVTAVQVPLAADMEMWGGWEQVLMQCCLCTFAERRPLAANGDVCGVRGDCSYECCYWDCVRVFMERPRDFIVTMKEKTWEHSNGKGTAGAAVDLKM